MSAADWASIVSSYRALVEACREDAPIADPWATFAGQAGKTRDEIPEHAGMMVRVLREIQGDRPPEALYLLDHGCGSGLNAMYLAALGYRNVFGVNVNDPVEHLNRIVDEIFGIGEARFATTDGGRLPFADRTFDFVISNQVLEHVGDDLIELYYSEEGRVLKPGGGAFHELPHAFIPFDSHSRTWFAHLFPRPLKPLAYGLFKSFERRKFMLHHGFTYARHYGSYLFLRSPVYHRRQIARHIGEYRDLTLERLLEPYNSENYDPDVNPLYRKIIDRLVRLPVVGSWLAKVFSNVVTVQTIAIKRL